MFICLMLFSSTLTKHHLHKQSWRYFLTAELRWICSVILWLFIASPNRAILSASYHHIPNITSLNIMLQHANTIGILELGLCSKLTIWSVRWIQNSSMFSLTRTIVLCCVKARSAKYTLRAIIWSRLKCVGMKVRSGISGFSCEEKGFLE